MREEGEGIPRMYEEMEESFLKQPEFHVEQTPFSNKGRLHQEEGL